jgi:hypothetical protein
MKYIFLLLTFLISFTLHADETKYGRFKVVSTAKSSHPCPTMTDTEMLAIVGPEDGDCVDNSILKNWMRYNASIPGWEELAGGGGAGGGIDDWATSHVYNQGDVVVESYKIYYCLADHSSGTFATDLAGGKWQLLKNEASNVEFSYVDLSSTNVSDAIIEVFTSEDSYIQSVETALSNHLADTTDAHDASAISNVPSGNTSSIDVQSAINELQGDINTNTSNISTNTTSIASNTSAIAGLDSTYATDADVALKANIASPTLTGDPKAPTATAGDNDTSIASTAFVQAAISGFSTTADLTTATGILAMSKGGTSKNLTPASGGLVYTDSDSMEILAAGTSGQVLQSNGSSAVSWSNRYISGKAGSATSVSVEELQTAPNKLTSTATNKYKLEGLDHNLLTNPSFDAAVSSNTTTGWTVTATGTATCTITQEQTGAMEGQKNFLKLAGTGGASGGTCSLKQLASVTKGLNHLIGFMVYSDPLGACPGGNPTVSARTVVAGSAVTTQDFTNCGTTNFWSPFYVNEVSSGTTSTGPEVILTVPASTSSYVAVDVAKVSPNELATASIITPWVAYTPTFTGFGTVAAQDFRWRQVGNSIEIEGRFTAGTTTATEARISLPNSYTSSSTYTTIEHVGTIIQAGNLAGGLYSMAEPSAGYITIGIQSSAAHAFTKAVASNVLPTGGTASVKASVKIDSLTGSTQVFATQCGAACEPILSAFVTDGAATTTVSDETEGDFVNGVCTNATAGNYSCPITGFTVTPKCWAIGVNNKVIIRAQATSSTNVDVATENNAGSNTDTNFTLFCKKQGADYITSRTIAGSFKDVVTTKGSTKPGLCSFYVSSGGTISLHNGGCVSSCTKTGTNTAVLTCTFNTGYWASTPNCTATPATDGGTGLSFNGSASSTTTFAATSRNATTPTNSDATVFCHGVIQ